MLNIRITTKSILLELGFEDRTFALFLAFKHKKIFNFEKHFPRTFKCSACGEKSDNEDTSLKLCDECLDDFMTSWRKKLR